MRMKFSNLTFPFEQHTFAPEKCLKSRFCDFQAGIIKSKKTPFFFHFVFSSLRAKSKEMEIGFYYTDCFKITTQA